MKSFDYVRPATVRDAVTAAATPGAAYLAAGTNLLDLMKGGVTAPNRLVDITHLSGLDRIEELPDGAVRIGALIRNADLAHHRNFARRFPAVAEALLSGASAQLRNAATVGGNLLQRTRCAYFYDTAGACNKRNPGSGCDAQGGDNRLHAILGWNKSCIATHPSDFCVPLVALDAVVELEGRAGRREIPLETFHRLPGDRPDRETVLELGEMIVAVRLPAEAVRFASVRHGSNIGQPLTRRDGVLKVTGKAKYAADHHPSGMLYAVLAVSTIARGRVVFLDVAAAKALPGVVEVITPANRPALAQDPDEKSNPLMFRLDLLQNDRVRYAGQPIAVVVAETLEAATEGAALLAPRYEIESARVALDASESFVPPAIGPGFPAEAHCGDVEAGLATATKKITATYETAAQYHNPMEPHAIVAAWEGDTLSIDTPSQGLAGAQARPAAMFGLSDDSHSQPVPGRRLRL